MLAGTQATVRAVIEALVVVGVIALIVAGNGLVWTNAVGLALVLHLVVLLVATLRGLLAGTVAAIAAATGLAILLDPYGSLRISEPANWVALVSFLLAAIIASHLVTRAREQAAAASGREQELARLYQLSIDLFSSADRHDLLERATRLGVETLRARGGCFIGFDGEVVRMIGATSNVSEDLLAIALQAAEARQSVVTDLEGERVVLVPRASADGSRVLAIVGTTASRGAVESVAALVSLAAEQQRFLESAAHLEALEESDRLKTGILRAVSHDLATPLATITIEIEALEREVEEFPAAKSRVASLRQDVGLLRRRIENLLAMARIESGTYRPHPEPLPAADLFRTVRHHLAIVAPGRALEIEIEPHCPDLWIDPALALEIVGNLVDNAHRASPEGATIELVARTDGSGEISVDVLDRGRGLTGEGTMSEGDVMPSGLGLDIARSLATASRATLELVSREGGGARARLVVPAFLEESLP